MASCISPLTPWKRDEWLITATFVSIVICQLGTAFAARTEHASLRSVGLTSNRLLLAGCVFEVAFTAALVYLPPLQEVFGTAALPGGFCFSWVPFPVIVWGTDELLRWWLRHKSRGTHHLVRAEL
jgi:magnesium-transporting ATPase (P-type)